MYFDIFVCKTSYTLLDMNFDMCRHNLVHMNQNIGQNNRWNIQQNTNFCKSYHMIPYNYRCMCLYKSLYNQNTIKKHLSLCMMKYMCKYNYFYSHSQCHHHLCRKLLQPE